MQYSLDDYSITAASKGWGPGWPTSRAADMARIETQRTGVKVNVHRRVAKLVKLLMDEDERRGYRYRQADTGGYNSRAIAGTNTPSNHSWGLAIDGNWQSNPVSHDGRAHTDYTAEMVARWRKYGFAWGGAYSGSYRDAMHREFMGSPTDADQMTAAAVRDLESNMPLTDDDVQKVAAAVVAKLGTGKGYATHDDVVTLLRGQTEPNSLAKLGDRLGRIETAVTPKPEA